MMKKTQFAFALLLLMLRVHGQQANNGFLLSGAVIYEEMIKMDIQLDGIDPEMAAQIPKEKTREKVLYFTDKESVYENHEKEGEEELVTSGGEGITIQVYEPDNHTYTDLENKRLIRQQEFMSRIFLIETELEAGRWKLTGRQNTILDYPCQEAIAEMDGRDVRAWFTSSIAVGAGPDSYNLLPGLVLAVDINEGERTLNARSVELMPLDESVLKKPSKGKKVSSEEFEAIVAEKMEEMGAESGGQAGSGTHTVVIEISQ